MSRSRPKLTYLPRIININIDVCKFGLNKAQCGRLEISSSLAGVYIDELDTRATVPNCRSHIAMHLENRPQSCFMPSPVPSVYSGGRKLRATDLRS